MTPEARPPILVDFVLRSDTRAKPGGDLHQIEQCCAHLSGRGIDVKVLEYSNDLRLRDDSLVHIVNIDRPFDFLEIVRAAKGRKILVSPIHHDLAAVERMRMNEKGQGMRSVVGRALPEWGREWVAFVVRSLLQNPKLSWPRLLPMFLRRAARAPSVWARVGQELDQAAAVFLLADGEAASIRKDTGWKGRNGVLAPNGRPSFAPPLTSWESRNACILVAGRIEPRKRQLEIARVAAQRGVSIRFVGPINASSASYGADFTSIVDTSSCLSWIGPMSHDDLVLEMSRTRVLLNASWVEVQSLVDLEAAFSGCYVVAADSGNSAEWLPGHVATSDVDDLNALVESADLHASRHHGPGLPDYPWTWERSARVLEHTYRNLSRSSPERDGTT